MPYTDADYDIKMTRGGTTHKLRLFSSVDGRTGTRRKMWEVKEIPPSPRPREVNGTEGVDQNLKSVFKMDDWSYGAGLVTFGPSPERPGHNLRYADGFNIDSSEPRQIRHGPGLASNVGTLNASPLDSVLHLDKVWFLTSGRLYSWDGTTLVRFWDNQDGALNLKMVVYGGSIFIVTSFFNTFTGATKNKYYHTTGAAVDSGANVNEVYAAGDVTLTVTNGALFSIGQTIVIESEHLYISNIAGNNLTVTRGVDGTTDASHANGTDIFIIMTAKARGTADDASEAGANIAMVTSNGTLYRAYNGNYISGSTTPAASTPTWTAGATVGDGDAIVSLFVVSGLIGVATRSTLYLLNEDLEAIELNRVLRSRTSTNSFSVKSESGSDVWFSDTRDIYRLLGVGFEIFDYRQDGPNYSWEEIPQNLLLPGQSSCNGIAQDTKAVYTLINRQEGAYVYKGKEITRGLFSWSPIRFDSGVTSTFMGLHKMTGDNAPNIYYNDSTTVKRFNTEWSLYADTWEFITTRFDAGVESWDKMAWKLRAFLDRSTSAAKVTCYYRVNNDTGWTLFGTTGEMTEDGNNEILLTTPIAYKRIQLRFVGSTSNTGQRVNLKSFLLEGSLRPTLSRTFDFSVIADTKTEADFLYNTRSSTTEFLTLVDRFGTSRSCILLPGYPEELELVDESRREPVRVYHIIGLEVT